jgi:aspartyl-tRNA(Asn)/glutamyl-tRNA(Gln) amidotransferase subunit A
MTLAALARALQTGELSPLEAVGAALRRIEALDGRLNAFITVRAEEALSEATSAGGSPPQGALWGVPLAVKDVIDVAGTPTTAGSRILATNVPAEDATVVERLRAAGAIVVGKLNTHEFAYGPLTTSEHFGRACNPWALDHVCGGSSGGSGAAVAAGLVTGTLGTDTAGSIRIPAAFCGVTGIRPSTGLVPTRGMVPLSPSVDTIGPMARNAEDCALLLGVIADPSVRGESRDYIAATTSARPRELQLGIVEQLFHGEIDPRVGGAARAAIDALREAGAAATAVELPHLERAGLVQQALQFPEATALHLDWLRNRPDDYGADVRGRLLAGLFVPATAYVTALRLRGVIGAAFRDAIEPVDCLVAPTLPLVAPRVANGGVVFDSLGDGSGSVAENLFRQNLLRYTAPWSLVGWPVVSVPCGFVDGLPVAVSFIGRRFDEEAPLRAAAAFQSLTDWHTREPRVAAGPAYDEAVRARE